MRALITGGGGFIGSTLAERLLNDGWAVRAIDCFTPYYDVAAKRRNVAAALAHPAYELVESDLRIDDLDRLLDGVDVVFHQAAQPGVRLSWSEGFVTYSDCNVIATQRLLEAARRCIERGGPLRRFVYASSSSVYGQAPEYPTTESSPTVPHSPYGVTKLAAELLCRAYAGNFGLPTVSLRYFTVYGPRQRPDMATHRLIEAALDQTPFPLFGDGSAVRDFTFVDDIVAANVAAATSNVASGSVYNAAGGSSISMMELIEMVGEVIGRPVPLDRRPAMPGDVERTGGSIELAERELGWSPQVALRDGLGRQADWHRCHRHP